jgi:hypothetical protein
VLDRVTDDGTVRHPVCECRLLEVAKTAANAGKIGRLGRGEGHRRRQHAELDVLLDAAAGDQLAEQMVEALAVEPFGGRGSTDDVGAGEMVDHPLPGGCRGVVRLVDKDQLEIARLVDV